MSTRKKPKKGLPQSPPSPDEKKPVARRMDTKAGGNHNESDEHELSDLAESGKHYSDNPVVAAVEQCLFRRGEVHLTALVNHKYDADEMHAFIRRVFDNETLCKIGTLVIEALITGDRGFGDTMGKAVKEADRIFHRDREKALLDKFAPFVWNFGDNTPPKRELLLSFAAKNNGRTLTEQQWRRARKALNLQEGQTGRPRKADTKP